MGVHHVEGAVRDLQSVRVAGQIGQFDARLDSLGAGQLQHIRADLQRGDPTGGEPPSEVDRDGAGAGTRIQQRLAGLGAAAGDARSSRRCATRWERSTDS